LGDIASYYVVTITGIEDIPIVLDAKNANTRDCVVTITSIEGARLTGKAVIYTITRNYVVAISSIEGAGSVIDTIDTTVEICPCNVVSINDCVVTITSINDASNVVNTKSGRC
jgi:hypothetical protein